MILRLFLICLVLVLSIGGGAGSVWLALREMRGLGAIELGTWVAFPDYGTAQADPYSRARFVREGTLALGQAEGIVFVARRDSAGRPLARQCAYRVEGGIPSSRFWTLYAANEDNLVLPRAGRRMPVLHSFEMLRSADSAINIAIGPHPAPENWIGTSGRGPLHLVLTLYDTPMSSGARVSEIELPQVVRGDCDV